MLTDSYSARTRFALFANSTDPDDLPSGGDEPGDGGHGGGNDEPTKPPPDGE